MKAHMVKAVILGTVSDDALAVMDKDVTNAFPDVLNWIRKWK